MPANPDDADRPAPPGSPSAENRAEILRKFPEVDLIRDEHVRNETIHALSHLPEYWHVAPASGSGKYHPPAHNETHGLWLHTKRAFVVNEHLIAAFDGIALDDHKADCSRAAILLHDMFKFGLPVESGGRYVYEDGDTAAPDHDMAAGIWLEANTDLPGEVIRCVKTHNGRWGQMQPTDHLSWMHHLADYVASRRDVRDIAIYEPCAEIRDGFPDVRVTTLG